VLPGLSHVAHAVVLEPSHVDAQAPCGLGAASRVHCLAHRCKCQWFPDLDRDTSLTNFGLGLPQNRGFTSFYGENLFELGLLFQTHLMNFGTQRLRSNKAMCCCEQWATNPSNPHEETWLSMAVGNLQFSMFNLCNGESHPYMRRKFLHAVFVCRTCAAMKSNLLDIGSFRVHGMLPLAAKHAGNSSRRSQVLPSTSENAATGKNLGFTPTCISFPCSVEYTFQIIK